MSAAIIQQKLDPNRTTWHITFGTYGTRLHGGARPTVDRQHNKVNEAFICESSRREEFERRRMEFPPRLLSSWQCTFVEAELPSICERGGWKYRICAAGTDHVHLLCDVMPAVHGEKVRRLVKRWLGQALSAKWPLPEGATWWAEEGSNKAVTDESYLNNCYAYILRQRATESEPGRPRPR